MTRLTIEQDPNAPVDAPALNIIVDGKLVAVTTIPGPWEPAVFIPGLEPETWDEIESIDLMEYLESFGITCREFADAFIPWVELAEVGGLPS